MNKAVVFAILGIIILVLMGITSQYWLPSFLLFIGTNQDYIRTIESIFKTLSLVFAGLIAFFRFLKKRPGPEPLPTPPSPIVDVNDSSNTFTIESEKLELQGDFVGRDKIAGDQITNSIVIKILDNLHVLESEGYKQFENFFQKYLEWVKNNYGYIQFRGIRRDDNEVLLLKFDDIYYPLYGDLVIDFNENGLDRKLRDIRMSDILSLGKHLVVTGSSGSGKTTVLTYIAYILSGTILENAPQLAKNKLKIDTARLPIPIIIPLNAYSRYLKKVSENSDLVKSFPNFIHQLFTENNIGFSIPEDFFARLVDSNQAILLFDGLDEIPDENLRVQVREDIENLSNNENLSIVVTCRTAGYKDRTILGKDFREIRMKPLTLPDVEQLITLAYNRIYPDNLDFAKIRIMDLMKGIRALEDDRRRRSIDAKQFVSNPLMVRLLILVHFSEHRLPEQRARLYMQATDSLLYPETSLTQDAGTNISNAIGGSWRVHRDMLQHLAYHMHKRGPLQGKEISENDLTIELCENGHFDPQDVGEFIKLVRLRSSVMEEANGVFRFIHLGFQEFLTARYLAEVKMSESGIEGVAQFLETGPVSESWWREPILLLVGYFSCDSLIVAGNFINRFAGLDEKSSEKKKRLNSDQQLSALEVSIASLLEWPEASRAIRLELTDRLRKVLRNEQLMNSARPFSKAEFGRSLGRSGDPRFNPETCYLPDEKRLGFIEIKAGPFLMGSSRADDRSALDDEFPQREVQVETFYLNKYPVTVDQFRYFLAQTKYLPKEGNCVSEDKVGNHPVIPVSWKDCGAYCAWLTGELKALAEKKLIAFSLDESEQEFWANLANDSMVARLPTEAEWEKAARGTDGRIYPWGNHLVKENANFGGTHGASTYSVGLFPSGHSPYGLLDMSGNVWEWTNTIYAGYPYRLDERESVTLSGDRVMRGGSFAFIPQRSRCATRYFGKPDFPPHDVGFRVAIAGKLV